ncbi:MAG: 4-(cytidine 5'-diphospho)-2-C-methyl-D-erythritol kinase [Clostridia bacterium]|nr:4-(cytidine 5'-diphospho)-2-C-methyl-D-erythritol kinase [Clostridia bacterium]
MILIKIKANAKINLTLDILGKRPDGYHLVDMIMQSVSLCDNIELSKLSENDIVVISSDNSLGGEQDICYKAAKLFFEKSDLNNGVKININKNIPLAAGLGGGSADAAAVLLALNKMFLNPLNSTDLYDIALNLGADVPFFLIGGTVYATGIGEQLKKLKDMPECYVLIVKNGNKKSTAQMYKQLDSAESYGNFNTNRAKEAINNGDLNSICLNIGNAFTSLWDINDIKSVMISNGALAVSLSGSGPSVFGIYDNYNNALLALNTFLNNNIQAFLTTPAKDAIVFE